MGRRRGRRTKKRRNILLISLIVASLVLLASLYHLFQGPTTEPVILYVNQGNGAVNESNFGAMLSFASSHGFNTVFFQVYREGTLLFNDSALGFFANQTHSAGLKIFFALYFTNSTQSLPAAIFGLGENGISLDMSGLGITTQQSLFQELGQCRCQTAVTTTDMNSQLRPDLLILETYGASYNQYIRHGIVASVGVFTTNSKTDYEAQLQYALHNSDGVMVFDYAGLLKSGY